MTPCFCCDYLDIRSPLQIKIVLNSSKYFLMYMHKKRIKEQCKSFF